MAPLGAPQDAVPLQHWRLRLHSPVSASTRLPDDAAVLEDAAVPEVAAVLQDAAVTEEAPVRRSAATRAAPAAASAWQG